MEKESEHRAPDSAEQTDLGNVMEVNEEKERTISHFRVLQLDEEGSVAQNGCSTNEVMKYVAILCFCSLHVFSQCKHVIIILPKDRF
jgi:hypothetical protein